MFFDPTIHFPQETHFNLMNTHRLKLISFCVWCYIGNQLHQDETTGCQKLTEVGEEHKLCVLWKAYGHRCCCWSSGWRMKGLCGSKSAAGTTKRVFPWSKVSWPMVMSACYWVKGILVTDQGELERESTNLFGVELGCQCEHSLLGEKKEKDKDIPGLMDTTVPGSLGPKVLPESTNFSISLKQMVSLLLLCQVPQMLAYCSQETTS